MKRIMAILGGLGAGAALMYLFDPKDGNRRRSAIRDKAVSMNTKTQDALSARVRDLSNRAKGIVHEAKSAVAKGSVEFGTATSPAGATSAGQPESFNQ